MKILVVKKPLKFIIIIAFALIFLLGIAQILRMRYDAPKVATEQPSLSYTIEAPLMTRVNLLPNSMYEATSLTEGQYVIRELVKSVSSQIDFKISTDEAAALSGTLTALVHLKTVYGEEGETLWDKTFELKKIPISGTGHFEYQGSFEDDLSLSRLLLEKAAAETDLSPGAVVEMGYHYEGIISNRNENLPFSGSKFAIIPMTLEVFKVESLSEGKDSESLSKTVMVSQTYTFKDLLPYYGLSGFGLLAIILSLFLIQNKPEKTAYTKSIEEIFNAYGDRLAKLEEALPNQFANVIHVNDFTDLIKISDEIRQPVFYFKIDEIDEQKIEFYVFDESRIYYLVKYDIQLQTIDQFMEKLA